jgi:hypothetical protein
MFDRDKGWHLRENKTGLFILEKGSEVARVGGA